MKIRHLSPAVFFVAGTLAAAPLTPWAELDAKNAIQIVNRLDYAENHLEGAKPGKTDDQVTVDFMGYASQKGLQAKGNGNTFTGTYTFEKENAAFAFKGEVTVKSPEELEYRISLSSKEEQEVKESFFSLRFNRAMLDRDLTFTIRGDKGLYQHRVKLEADKNSWLWSSPKGQPVEKVTIPLMHGELELSGFSVPAMVCKYGALTGNLRLYLASGKVKQLDGSLKLRFTPYRTVKFDLSKAANMGLVDEVADDRKGGWTDQGPQNDMRKLPIGPGIYGNIPFEVADPAKNGGKAVLAFANPARSYFLREAVIEAKGARFDRLSLLHAAAWCKGGRVGAIRVDYQGGGHDLFEVDDRRDVGNWWGGAESFDNATLIWRSQNQSSLIGLYLSRFEVKNKPVEKITFTTADNAVWLVVAATGVAGDPPFPRGSNIEVPYAVEEGKEYKRFTFHKDRVPGSALDFSGYLDAPAGTYGRVVIKNGRFVFEQRPERPLRFLGANICQDANLLEPAQTDRMVDRIVKAGYNAVRLHHFDQGLMKPGSTTLEFDPERLDRFYYLIAKCKERGLYVTLDLYTRRSDGFPVEFGGRRPLFDVKSLMMFSPELRDNLKEFSRRLLTTVNPHTGLALKDDPALIFVGLINEDPMTTHHKEYKYPNGDPKRQALIKAAFEAWCAKNGVTPVAKPGEELYLRFLLDHQKAVYDDLKNFLREIGVASPLSDISAGNQFALAVPRSHFDYVDLHFYFDHPTFPKEFFKMPYEIHDRSAVSGGFRELLRCGAARIPGKPFTVTEFNFCVPNRQRSEGGAAAGAFAAMQEWDGIFRFQFIGYDFSWKNVDPLGDGGHLGSFSLANDPIQALSELMTHIFYLRGDVAPARETATLRIPADVWRVSESRRYLLWAQREEAEPPMAFLRAGLARKIGMAVGDAGGTDGLEAVLKNKSYPGAPKGPAYVSSTGELFTDTKAGTFKVVTPKSEALVTPGRSLEGKRLKVAGNTVFATVFAGSLDNQPLESSKRILVLHLTDVKATGQKLGVIENRLRMYNWGNFIPYLVRRGSAKITLDLGPGSYTVRALGVDGAKLHEVPAVVAADGLSFTAATDCGPEDVAVFAYEVIRN